MSEAFKQLMAGADPDTLPDVIDIPLEKVVGGLTIAFPRFYACFDQHAIARLIGLSLVRIKGEWFTRQIYRPATHCPYCKRPY